ncbi:MAG: hypothetical protein HOP28_16845 [Gemmatimonadales bacterium]|nr:hypothetical protein [Gemmatimonadales bacterium]
MRVLAIVLLLVLGGCSRAPLPLPALAALPGSLIPVDTSGAIAPVVRALAALDRLDWPAFKAELDTTDFTCSFLPLQGGRPMTDWAEIASAFENYFQLRRPDHDRLGLVYDAWRATKGGSFVHIIDVRMSSGPVLGWWTFVVGARQDGKVSIGLFYGIGAPEDHRHDLLPLRRPSTWEL